MPPASFEAIPPRGDHNAFAMTQPYYETMYILRPDIPEEEVDTHIAKYRDLVTEAGGEVLDTQMRGKRRLAYSIGKHREGIYVQLNHNGDGQQVAPLERAMRLSEDVIRYLTVKQTGPMPPPRSLVTSEAAAATPATAPAAGTATDD
jgi:small subunit ribosomal protein S6